MAANIVNSDIPQVSSPLTDPKTGFITQPWLYLILALWRRTGGATGTIIRNDVESEDGSPQPIFSGSISVAPEPVVVNITQSSFPEAVAISQTAREDAPLDVRVPVIPDAYADPSSGALVAKANLPTPGPTTVGYYRFVTDATGAVDLTPAYCTFTQWRRFSDDSVIN